MKRTWLVMIICAMFAGSCFAEHVIRLQGADPGKGAISDFKITVLDEAMKRTVKQYGPYRYESVTITLSRDRMLEELADGTVINAAMTATQPTWEERLIPVRVPIDMGLSGLRISLIRSDAQPRIAAVKNLEELKALRMDVGVAWSSRKVAEAEGFQIVTGENYDALLKTLMQDRADYFPRSLNEAFSELDARGADNPGLAIDKVLLLHLPLPSYIFVSPKTPRLAKRIEEGMEMIVRDGTLRKLMLKFNEDIIMRADLCNRRVFHLNNPMLTPQTPLKRKELWFDPFDPKTGICRKPSRRARAQR